MRNIFFIVVLFSLSATILYPQQKTTQSAEYVFPESLQVILAEARTLQPELTIDIYLKIIASGKITNKLKKKQLLEEAFYLTFYTKQKVRRKLIPFDGAVLTSLPTFISYAQDNKLDELSLKVRIVSEMLKIDRVRAFELFNEISPNLTLKPLSCQDFLLYELTDFYSLVGKMAADSFNREQINQGQRTVFLSPYIENITSPLQLLTIIKVISAIDLTNEEKINLTDSLNKSIRKISADDDRSFSYAMNFGSTNRAMYEFSRKLFFNTALYDEFRKSYRSFLVKNLQSIRCQDNIEYEKESSKSITDSKDIASDTMLPIYIYEANKYFFKDSPINYDETKPYKIESINFPVEYFTSGKGSQIIDKLRELQNWKDESKTTSQVKNSAEWQEAFSNLLDEIDEWSKADNEEDIDLFHQKSLVYRLLLRESATDAFREKIITKYLKLLNQNAIQKDFVLQWFLEFDELRKEVYKIDSEKRTKFIDALANSDNSAVRLYLDLEKLCNQIKTLSKTKNQNP